MASSGEGVTSHCRAVPATEQVKDTLWLGQATLEFVLSSEAEKNHGLRSRSSHNKQTLIELTSNTRAQLVLILTCYKLYNSN